MTTDPMPEGWIVQPAESFDDTPAVYVELKRDDFMLHRVLDVEEAVSLAAALVEAARQARQAKTNG